MYMTDPKPCAQQIKIMEAHGFTLIPTTESKHDVHWAFTLNIKQKPYDLKIRLSSHEVPTPADIIKLCIWASYYDGEKNRAKMISNALNCEDLP